MSKTIEVEIVEAQLDRVLRERVCVRPDASVRDALRACTLERASAILRTMQSVQSAQLVQSARSARSARSAQSGEHIADSFVGIWGRRVLLDTKLENNDRIELYRELVADAKTARLKRANEQGYRWQGRTRRAVKQTPN
jgi:putative ubiquitin-RnfH superfamily antitoxin RatB of RatAB toxin-antitoxin module